MISYISNLMKLGLVQLEKMKMIIRRESNLQVMKMKRKELRSLNIIFMVKLREIKLREDIEPDNIVFNHLQRTLKVLNRR